MHQLPGSAIKIYSFLLHRSHFLYFENAFQMERKNRVRGIKILVVCLEHHSSCQALKRYPEFPHN